LYLPFKGPLHTGLSIRTFKTAFYKIDIDSAFSHSSGMIKYEQEILEIWRNLGFSFKDA
jgi:hypothetical protein